MKRKPCPAVNKKDNENVCPCPFIKCPRHGVCCECLQFCRATGLPVACVAGFRKGFTDDELEELEKYFEAQGYI